MPEAYIILRMAAQVTARGFFPVPQQHDIAQPPQNHHLTGIGVFPRRRTSEAVYYLATLNPASLLTVAHPEIFVHHQVSDQTVLKTKTSSTRGSQKTTFIMARYLNNNSSNRKQLQQYIKKTPQTSVLASCYSVNASTSAVKGFHYCTTTGTGMFFFAFFFFLAFPWLWLHYIDPNSMLMNNLFLPVGSQWYP